MAGKRKKASAPRSKKAALRKKAAPRKKTAPRKKAASTLTRVENAILSAVSEVDELAMEMGLAGAVPPKKAKRAKRGT